MYTVLKSRLGYVLPKPVKFNQQKHAKIAVIVGARSYSHHSQATKRFLQCHDFRTGYKYGSSRPYGTLIFRAVKGVLKLRYLLLGGAITGGISLQKKYEEWKGALDGVDKFMPSSERIDSFRNSLVEFKDKVKAIEIDPRIMKIGESKWSQTQEWLNKRIAEAYAAAELRENESDNASRSRLLADAITKVREGAENKIKVKALPFASEAKPESDEKNPKSFWKFGQGAKDDDRVEVLQQELMEVQLKYQKEIERLEKDNKELKKQLLLSKSHRLVQKQIKKSLIDMYSEVLDELSDYDTSYSAQDHLPRVVVVGDQSSGKTSVLEMVAQARIFPRGAGEMMTRAPVKVTLSEGPYHVAQFKDSDREFDLTNEDDLRKLRTEVELRMKRSLSKGKTVSNEVISMTVKGPGLQRMVLVDLPGIISTVTRDMAADTKEAINKMTMHHMSNPNSIILCIQDGSVDAERSNVTDLVAQIDPSGKRTIFVLTKVDMAEENLTNPQRIQKILSGRLFPMKALGYFAVVTGRGNKDESISEIKTYEENFFRNSKLFRNGRLSTSQMTTKNLSFAVSECFWKMVRETVEQQADAFKATRFNLETEWKNTFPNVREMDRDELFDKGRGEILDEVINLSQVSVSDWESLLSKKLWEKTYYHFMDSIYIPATLSSNAEKFNTMADIRLRDWAKTELAAKSIEAGTEALRHELMAFMEKSMNAKEGADPIFEKFKKFVFMEALNRHKWEDKGNEMIRLIQLNTLEDRCINDKESWTSAVNLLEKCLKQKLQENDKLLQELIGPGPKEKWLYWKYSTEEQNMRRQIKNELEKIVHSNPDHGPALTADELMIVKKNIQSVGLPEPSSELVYSTWPLLFSRHFLQKNIDRAYSCRRGYFMYKVSREVNECQDVVLFWRLEQMLKVTATALRQQVMNREAKRLDKIIKEVLDDFSQDQELKVKLLTGRRVQLAEELKRVRQIQEKLEEFIQALNKEK